MLPEWQRTILPAALGPLPAVPRCRLPSLSGDGRDLLLPAHPTQCFQGSQVTESLGKAMLLVARLSLARWQFLCSELEWRVHHISPLWQNCGGRGWNRTHDDEDSLSAPPYHPTYTIIFKSNFFLVLGIEPRDSFLYTSLVLCSRALSTVYSDFLQGLTDLSRL